MRTSRKFVRLSTLATTLILMSCQTPTTVSDTSDVCLAWEEIKFARDVGVPETASNFQDTDKTVADIRKNNARRNRICK